jgi:tRNA(Ile)-lysidine synthase
MHKFVRNLLTEWRKLDLPFADKTYIVAVSGGADSVALALALADLKKRKKLDLHFVIAHFNHDLRGAESENDAEFVKEFAGNIEFESVYQKGKVSKKGNLEQNARLARYEFLTETAENHRAGGILTAHTINDQAETFLANLFRGSGLKGLSAMSPVITNYELRITNHENQSHISHLKSEIALVRPLLNWAMREDTENFCRFCEIDFRNDSMNEDLNFTRVKIRRQLIPALKEFNPKIVETLSKTARLLQTELKAAVENEGFPAQADNECLLLKDLKKLSKSNLYKVLREWLEAKRGNLRRLELKHIEAIERLIVSRKSGKIVELPDGESVVKESGKLFWRNKTL